MGMELHFKRLELGLGELGLEARGGELALAEAAVILEGVDHGEDAAIGKELEVDVPYEDAGDDLGEGMREIELLPGEAPARGGHGEMDGRRGERREEVDADAHRDVPALERKSAPEAEDDGRYQRPDEPRRELPDKRGAEGDRQRVFLPPEEVD